MQYKTILLDLLEQRPQLYERLRQQGILLQTLDQYTQELRTIHEKWQRHLRLTHPASELQIRSEALELALEEFQRCLPNASEDDASDGPTLDGAMAYIQSHMQNK